MENENKPASLNSSSSIGLDVIRVLVSHGGKDFLGIRLLGRLSLGSKSVAAILDDADVSIWKTLFEEAATCGRIRDANHEAYLDGSGYLYGMFGHFLRSYHRSVCWKEEDDGLLACFSNPSSAVLDRVGYVLVSCL
jgi:hypothetical protein